MSIVIQKYETFFVNAHQNEVDTVLLRIRAPISTFSLVCSLVPRDALRKQAHIIYCNISLMKNDYFLMKNCDIFLIFAQNIDCGYTLEPSK